MWDRWQSGDSLHEIARLFDRGHSSIQGVPSGTVRKIKFTCRCSFLTPFELEFAQEFTCNPIKDNNGGTGNRFIRKRFNPVAVYAMEDEDMVMRINRNTGRSTQDESLRK